MPPKRKHKRKLTIRGRRRSMLRANPKHEPTAPQYDYDEILAALKLTPGRFAGRKDLTAAAERGENWSALVQLAKGLGRDDLAEIARSQVYWAAQPKRPRATFQPGSPPRPPAWGAPYEERAAYSAAAEAYREDLRRQEALRAYRAKQRAVPEPTPARMLAMADEKRAAAERARLLKLVRQAKQVAGIREATHSHKDVIVLVEPGKERAASDTGTMWASDAGMSKAYQKRAYRVAYSVHTWYLSPGSEPVGYDGMVGLTDAVAVKNGRGTSLQMQRAGTRGWVPV